MKDFIARENIRRFEAQLAHCSDPQKRETLEILLKAERRHLSDAIAEKATNRTSAPIRGQG